jgi:PAS domain S-box-containing protein
MYNAISAPEAILQRALAVAEEGGPLAALEELPAPIYVTDTDGVVIYFNSACVEFAGRTPVVGTDRWCVTWKLYTDDGEFLPHDRCPMAEAIIKKNPIRGVTAVAERPDGSRVNFMPFPTPLLGPEGELRGAVNMLIDVTAHRQMSELRSQAYRCRRLADSAGNTEITRSLNLLAEEYEAKLASLNAPN